MTESVLIALDLGETSRQVLEAGLRIAEALHAPPVLVHVDASAYVFTDAFNAIPASDLERMKADYRAEALDRLRALLAATGRAPESAESDVVEGRVHEAIVAAAEARRAQAIVVGSHVRQLLERLLLGRTAQRVIREAHAAVFTVNVHAPWSGISRILYATDLGPEAPNAERWAARLAGTLGVPLTVAHVVDFGANLAAPYVIPPEVQESIRASYVERLETLRQRLAALGAAYRPGPSRVSSKLVTAHDVAAGILETARAEGADLVITSTHGRRGLKRAVLGSVAEGVANRAHTCVLTVHE